MQSCNYSLQLFGLFLPTPGAEAVKAAKTKAEDIDYPKSPKPDLKKHLLREI